MRASATDGYARLSYRLIEELVELTADGLEKTLGASEVQLTVELTELAVVVALEEAALVSVGVHQGVDVDQTRVAVGELDELLRAVVEDEQDVVAATATVLAQADLHPYWLGLKTLVGCHVLGQTGSDFCIGHGVDQACDCC